MALNPDQPFIVQTVTRAIIAQEINDVLDADHQLALDDDRLTDAICQEYADSLGEQPDLDEDDAAAHEYQLAIYTAHQVGLYEFLTPEARADSEWEFD